MNITIFKSWLPFAVSITLIYIALYGVVQQDIRSGANDLPMQIAEDYKNQLESGLNPSTLLSPLGINLEKSLGSFFVIYDAAGNPIVGTGFLDNALPKVPIGVLNHAKEEGENQITWKPKEDVREAIVVLPYTSPSGSGFVLAGRSLRQVEEHVEVLTTQVFLAWIITLIASLFSIFLVDRWKNFSW